MYAYKIYLPVTCQLNLREKKLYQIYNVYNNTYIEAELIVVLYINFTHEESLKLVLINKLKFLSFLVFFNH